MIEERLRAAKAVVVVWSEDAVKSQWVRAEADIAREAGTLVQLRLDEARLPMPFNRIQCADLCGWRGDAEALGWKKVAASIADLIAGEVSPPAPLDGGSQTPGEPGPDIYAVAVAPIADPAGTAAGDDFAEGLGAEIATALARFLVLQVVEPGPGSAARYQLGGAIRRSGAQLRVNLHLRDTARGETVWAERFECAGDDLFAVQDDLACVVAGRVEAALLAHETRRLAGRPPETLTAHQLWLRARESIRRGGLQQVDEIEAFTERAVALDPGHARSLSLLAAAIGFRLAYAGADSAGYKARNADLIERALVAGADDPDVLTFVAEAHLLADGDMVAARALVDRALLMNPGLGAGWDIAGNIRMQAGEYEEALSRYQRFLHLDPNSPWRTWVWPSMAGCLATMGRFDEAIALAKEGLQIGPNNPWGAATLIAALAHSGRMDEAREALARFDPRQAGVLRSNSLGPKLSGMVSEALKLAGWKEPETAAAR